MAKSVISLTPKEAEYFHENYTYMWKKLNTMPYYVSGFGEVPPWINNEESLPSYVNLSKCLNQDYIPSMNLVNKIVTFYNSNLYPKINTLQFLSEYLIDTDSIRRPLASSNVSKYIGLYYIYYYADLINEKEIVGGLLWIYENGGAINTRIISGVNSNDALYSRELKDLICSKESVFEKYEKYKAGLSLSHRKTYLYEGTFDCIPGLVTINMHCLDHDGRYLMLRLPIDAAINEEYYGSLGFLSLFDKGYNIQLMNLGTIKANVPEFLPVNLHNEKLPQLLQLQKNEDEHVRLYYSQNSTWADFIMRNLM